jgi:hypothetical protein
MLWQDRDTALLAAATGGHVQVVESLEECGAATDATNRVSVITRPGHLQIRSCGMRDDNVGALSCAGRTNGLDSRR